MFLAACFHTSAFFAFPIAYALGYITNINKKTSKVLILVAIILFVIPFDLLLDSGSYLILMYLNRYDMYVNQAEEIAKGASLLVKTSNLIIILCLIKGMIGVKLTPNQTRVVILGLLAWYFPMLGPLDMRMSMYFTILMIPSVIIVYSKIRNKMLKNVMLLTVVAYQGYSLFIVYMNSPSRVSKIHNHFFELFMF